MIIYNNIIMSGARGRVGFGPEGDSGDGPKGEEWDISDGTTIWMARRLWPGGQGICNCRESERVMTGGHGSGALMYILLNIIY